MGEKRKKAILIIPHGKIMEINESVVIAWILALEARYVFTAEAYH